MRSRRREGVVVVVSGLPEPWQREQKDVARMIRRREPAAAEKWHSELML
jgi:hypothetical protein